MSKTKGVPLVAGAVLLSGCTANYEDIGRMALLGAPTWLLAGWLCAAGLLRIWRDFAARRLVVGRWPTIAIGAVALLGAVYAVLTMTPDGWRYLSGDRGTYLVAVAMAGGGYVALSLVALRIWLFRRDAGAWEAAFTWAHVLVLVPYLLVAWLLVGFGEEADWALLPLLYTALAGWYGIPPLLILGALLLEARGRARRAAGVQEPANGSST